MTIEVRIVARYLGLIVFVFSALIFAVAGFGGVEYFLRDASWHEPAACGLAAAVSGLLGGLLFLAGRSGGPKLVGQREALLLVALSWLLGAALAALPFWIWANTAGDARPVNHEFRSYVNCLFEATSGLTTTGATVLSDIGHLPRSLLLWRALLQCLGGLGIVVLFVAVLPLLGVGSRRMYRSEVPGLSKEGVTPRIQDTARILLMIYAGLNVLGIIALRLAGMDWFDAVCHAFTAYSTGGFSTKDASIGAYPVVAIQLVIIAMMVLGGMDFALYHQILRGKWRNAIKDEQFRLYLTLLLLATIIITIDLRVNPPPSATTAEPVAVADTLREAGFQAVAIQTTTGYGSADFDQWGFASKAVLVALMFIGGSAGSTSGGLKVVRILIAIKVIWSELEHVYRPRVVRAVRVGKSAIEPELRLDTLVFIISLLGLFVMGTAALMLIESGRDMDITTAATATISCLHNVGPGLAKVGPALNYGWLSDPGKLLLSLLMVVGRLEMFTILVLLTPRFWHSD